MILWKKTLPMFLTVRQYPRQEGTREPVIKMARSLRQPYTYTLLHLTVCDNIVMTDLEKF
jgi:hypothetical protein